MRRFYLWLQIGFIALLLSACTNAPILPAPAGAVAEPVVVMEPEPVAERVEEREKTCTLEGDGDGIGGTGCKID